MIILNKKYRVVLDKNKKLGNLTKRSLFALSIPFYRITTSNEYNYTFFLIPKTGISTILATLRAVSEPEIDELTVIYNNLNHLNKFKFCFIRNPWDRLVSCYSNKILRKKLYPECWHKDFEFFIQYLTKQHLATSEGHIRLQSSSFPINGIDFIGRFENFKQDFNYVINDKLKLNKELIKKNPSKHRNYTSYYNDRTRKIVEELYKSDIELGNYIFGE